MENKNPPIKVGFYFSSGDSNGDVLQDFLEILD